MKLVRTRGFTLAEVIVVVGIIGILAAVVIASISEARANARDKVREADRAQIQLAVRLYQEQAGDTPLTGTICRSCEAQPGGINAAVQAFIGEMEDPRHGSDYYYSLEPQPADPGVDAVCVQFERDEVGERSCLPIR